MGTRAEDIRSELREATKRRISGALRKRLKVWGVPSPRMLAERAKFVGFGRDGCQRWSVAQGTRRLIITISREGYLVNIEKENPPMSTQMPTQQDYTRAQRELEQWNAHVTNIDMKILTLRQVIEDKVKAHRPTGRGWQYSIEERDQDNERLQDLHAERNRAFANGQACKSTVEAFEKTQARTSYDSTLAEMTALSARALPFARRVLCGLDNLHSGLAGLTELFEQHDPLSRNHDRARRSLQRLGGDGCPREEWTSDIARFPLVPGDLLHYMYKQLQEGRLPTRESIVQAFPLIERDAVTPAPVANEDDEEELI